MIPRFYFKESKDKEVINYYMSVNGNVRGTKDFSKVFPEEFVNKIRDKNFEDVKKIIEEKVEEDYKIVGYKVKPHLKEVERKWKKIEKISIKRLEKIMKRKFLAKEVTVYGTILSKCDYMPKLPNPGFKVSIHKKVENSLRTMMHEMMHFMFHWHYWDYCRKYLSEDQTWHLKEAVTFILNEEFSDILKVKDTGYETHKELREELTEIWRETKDFEKFLDKSFKIVKKYF